MLACRTLSRLMVRDPSEVTLVRVGGNKGGFKGFWLG